jgi:UDP-glucuronate decarboxylase
MHNPWFLEVESAGKHMRVIITGGAGFIGSHLVDQLLSSGDQVVVIDNYLTGRRVNLAHLGGVGALTVVEHDVATPWIGPWTDEPVDRIYHLASPASPVGYARYPIETQLTNTIGTKHALDLAVKHQARFIFTSTSEIYGDPLVHPQPETYWGNVNPIGPRACYDESKRFGESLIMEYHRQYGLDIRIARLFNTYGPRSDPQDGRVVPNFCMQAMRNEPITIYGSGDQTRSFCYVDDLVQGLISLMETGDLAGQVVNLGNPAEITVRAFAEEVVRLAGSSSPIINRPLPVDDPTRRRPDITKARQLLGWQPNVDLETGLGKTLQYFSELLESSTAG